MHSKANDEVRKEKKCARMSIVVVHGMDLWRDGYVSPINLLHNHAFYVSISIVAKAEFGAAAHHR